MFNQHFQVENSVKNPAASFENPAASFENPVNGPSAHFTLKNSTNQDLKPTPLELV